MNNLDRKHGLTRWARLALFIVSYIPLFAIMAFQQIYKNKEYLNFDEVTLNSIKIFFEKFGISVVLIAVSCLALSGLLFLLRNLEERADESGDVLKVTEVENKNSEAVAYLFTYIIPFVFQDLSDLSQLIPIMALMTVTYAIYVNSSMMLINPTLSFWYSLYQIEYTDSSTSKKKAIVLSKERFMEEGDFLKTKRIAHKLRFGIDLGKKDEHK